MLRSRDELNITVVEKRCLAKGVNGKRAKEKYFINVN